MGFNIIMSSTSRTVRFIALAGKNWRSFFVINIIWFSSTTARSKHRPIGCESVRSVPCFKYWNISVFNASDLLLRIKYLSDQLKIFFFSVRDKRSSFSSTNGLCLWLQSYSSSTQVLDAVFDMQMVSANRTPGEEASGLTLMWWVIKMLISKKVFSLTVDQVCDTFSHQTLIASTTLNF